MTKSIALLCVAVSALGLVVIGPHDRTHAADPDSYRQLRSSLVGRWRSSVPEPIASANGSAIYLTRNFELSERAWTIRFTVSADGAGDTPLFSGRNSGTYQATDGQLPSGAFAAEFAFDMRELTAHTDAIATSLTAAGCGTGPWGVGVAQQVYPAGCTPFRVFPQAICPQEFDLVRLQDGNLTFGVRPADGNLCAPERRPKSTGAPLARAP